MQNYSKQVKQILNTLNIQAPPVPIEKIAELFNLKVVPYSKFHDSISGVIIQQEDLNVVGVNSNHAIVRQRFSIAHELGHYLLGHDSTKMVDTTFDVSTNKEQQANEFAAELLMPLDLLKKDIENHPREYDIPALAKRYDVSAQAISVRLLQTGLIKKMRLSA
ncbi:MAG: ImmA/IrrE family metallo-endopeptidase [Bacilli bacterium]|nr:ImmA/IrrE family metallo-endopeptidase [Bacilli bacterium]